MEDQDHEGKKILVIQTHGVATPTRTYSPLFYAMAAAAMEMEVMVWFTMDGTNQLKKGEAEKVQLDKSSNVTLKTMLEEAGFEDCQYHNLAGGIVALHRGYKY